MCTVNKFSLTSNFPFVCQNHRSISCTLVKFSLAAVNTQTNFPCPKSGMISFGTRLAWQGKIVNVLPYTRANITCQGKIACLYEAFSTYDQNACVKSPGLKQHNKIFYNDPSSRPRCPRCSRQTCCYPPIVCGRNNDTNNPSLG